MREKPTPSEGVNRQLPKPVCASSMFGDNGSGSEYKPVLRGLITLGRITQEPDHSGQN